MKRAVTIRLAAWVSSLILITSGLWMIYSSPARRNSQSLRANLKETQPPGPSSKTEANLKGPVLAVPEPPVRTANPATAVKPAESSRDALALIKEFDKLSADPPSNLSNKEAKELLARRQQAKGTLLDQLANLGPGGARSISDAFRQTDTLRDRQILAQALGKLQDTEAVPVLKELLSGQSGFYERKELIVALAHRPESAAVEPLTGVLAGGQPGALQFSAVQGLAGRADALPVLAATIEDTTDQAVRLEAIRSVGRIGNDAAKRELIGLAEKSSLEPIVRQTAIQELRRSFGASAQNVLQSLASDSQPDIRQTAAQALAMLHR